MCVSYVVQACHVEGGSAGLIPSQMLEEKRKAFVKRDVELAPAGNKIGGRRLGWWSNKRSMLTSAGQIPVVLKSLSL